MNEDCSNFNDNHLLNMCCVCLCVENIQPVLLEELSWYRNVVYTTTPQCVEYKMKICVYCRQLMRKFRRFTAQCQSANVFISQTVYQGTFVERYVSPETSRDIASLHISSNTSNLSCQAMWGDVARRLRGHMSLDGWGRSFNIAIKDTKPLLHPQIFTHNLSSVILPQSDDEIISEMNFEAALDEPSFDDDDLPLVLVSEVKRKKKKRKKERKPIEEPQSKPNKKKQLREGFSSRMVQETDEYTVIKLTKEQVTNEMQVRSDSELYQRAPFKCELCVKGFNFQDVLTAHMEKHSKSRGSFKCDLCSQYCPSAVSLFGHLKSHTTRYECKVCGCVRMSRQHLLEHHRNAHSGAPTRYTCDQCSFSTDKRTVIQRHVRSHRASPQYNCDRCKKTYSSKEALRVHTARHDSSVGVRCAECGRRFVLASHLARHVAAHHSRCYCVECDKTFNSQDNLRLHFKKAKKHRDTDSYLMDATKGIQKTTMKIKICDK